MQSSSLSTFPSPPTGSLRPVADDSTKRWWWCERSRTTPNQTRVISVGVESWSRLYLELPTQPRIPPQASSRAEVRGTTQASHQANQICCCGQMGYCRDNEWASTDHFIACSHPSVRLHLISSSVSASDIGKCTSWRLSQGLYGSRGGAAPLIAFRGPAGIRGHHTHFASIPSHPGSRKPGYSPAVVCQSGGPGAVYLSCAPLTPGRTESFPK